MQDIEKQSASDAALSATLPEPNRQGCINRLEEALAVEDKKKLKKGAVIKLYLQNFKLFNDTFGYRYGGLLLAKIADMLQSVDGSELFRYTGVEFILILQGSSYTAAVNTAQEILDRFENPWRINDMDCMCSVDMALVFYPGFAENATELLECLDQGITEATYRGTNHMVIYDTDLQNKFLRKYGIAAAIKTALQDSSFEIRYRPTYCVESKRFTRGECYLRMFTDEFGIINSAEFLPIAEESGQICSINIYAIRKVCADIKQLLAQNKEFETLAVPISAVQLLQENFCDDVVAILEEFDIPANKLAFEITETMLFSCYSNVLFMMEELANLGIEFVLAEFGTGFSGINNILSMPVQVLKLERLFVWQLETDPRSGVVIEGLIGIANKLGLKLIAEGVETENQLTLLDQYGCAYEQGFFFSPTVNFEELCTLFGASNTNT